MNLLVIDGSVPGILIIAHMVDGDLVSLYYDTGATDAVGNIYLGRVTNIMASLSAYFVDYGADKNGFLPFSSTIEQLKRDDIIIVQVVKNSKESKGARLSCFVKLAGRYSIFMPKSQYKDGKTSITRQQHSNYHAISHELKQLEMTWSNIVDLSTKARSPQLLHRESGLVQRILRDKYIGNELEIYIDGHDEFIKTNNVITEMSLPHQVKEYKGILPIFSRFGIGNELKKLTSRVIDLNSGGSVVIDISEAMVCIDINSSSCSQGDLEDTAYRVNLEAAKEIAKQIRLRDLSGIIAIDFIDMSNEHNLKQIELTFRNAFQNDTAMTRISGINEFGVLMMSRQRSNLNLYQQFYSQCNICIGHSFIKTTEMLAFEILNEIRLSIFSYPKQLISVECESRVSHFILNKLRSIIYHLEKHGNQIEINTNNQLSNTFKISPKAQVKLEKATKPTKATEHQPKLIMQLMQDLQLTSFNYIISPNMDIVTML